MSIENELIQLGETKNLIKNAIINKGVEVDSTTPFREYADKIGEISGGGGEKEWKYNYIDTTPDFIMENVIYHNNGMRFYGNFTVDNWATANKWEINLRYRPTASQNATIINMLSLRSTSGAYYYGYNLRIQRASSSGNTYLYLSTDGETWDVFGTSNSLIIPSSPIRNTLNINITYDNSTGYRATLTNIDTGAVLAEASSDITNPIYGLDTLEDITIGVGTKTGTNNYIGRSNTFWYLDNCYIKTSHNGVEKTYYFAEQV